LRAEHVFDLPQGRADDKFTATVAWAGAEAKTSCIDPTRNLLQHLQLIKPNATAPDAA
jgi:hypothetical protein